MRLNYPLRIGLFLIWITGIGWTSSSTAQIVPDRTLTSESSQLQRQGNTITINGGANRGPFLFHSFDQFSIPDTQSVFFANPSGIDTILSRVTGNDASTIDGTLGVLGSADLFLLNPNGILFGPNAQLDMAGSFTASTGDRLSIGDFDFSAVDPAPVPLLTLDITPGIQLGENQDGLIRNQAALSLSPRQSLTFASGTIEQAGQITIPSGTVRLRGDAIALTGTVDTRNGGRTAEQIATRTGQLQLSSPTDLPIRANTPLTTAAISQALETNNVEVESDRDLTIRGRIVSTSPTALDMRAGNTLRWVATSADPSQLGGNLAVQSAGDIVLKTPLSIVNPNPDPSVTLQAGADLMIRRSPTLGDNPEQLIELTGSQGQFLLQGDTVSLDQTRFFTLPTGKQRGPDIEVNAGQDLTLLASEFGLRAGDDQTTGRIRLQAGNDITLQDSGLFAFPLPGTVMARTGNMNIHAGQSIQLLSAGVSGFGPITQRTGNITLRAGDTVALEPAYITTQEVISSVASLGTSGNIIVEAKHIRVDGAERAGATVDENNLLSTADLSGIGTTTLGPQGDAGDLTLTATESITIIGSPQALDTAINPETFSIDDLINAFTFSAAAILPTAFGEGESGELRIQTNRLDVQGRVVIGNATGFFGGEGTDSGGVLIEANDVRLDRSALLGVGTAGDANGADLRIESDRIYIGDRSAIGSATAFGTGNGGDVVIRTGALILDGGTIVGNTGGEGNGGTVDIIADTILATGFLDDSLFPAGIFTGVVPLNDSADNPVDGRGGELLIQSNTLTLLDGGEIRASTEGNGNAGNMTIQANQVLISGEGSSIEARSISPGQAGELTIRGDRLFVNNGGQINTESIAGNGGNINLNFADSVVLQRQGLISTSSGTEDSGGGNGGNITIGTGFVIAPGNQNSDITANAFDGNGGNININTNGLLLGITPRNQTTDFSDITASSNSGLDGTITIAGLVDDLAPEPLDLPDGLVEGSDRITAGCLLDEDASFVVTGRGGIPANPREILSQVLVWDDSRTTEETRSALISAKHRQSDGSITHHPLNHQAFTQNDAETVEQELSEAQGWQVNRDRQIELVTTHERPAFQSHSGCHTSLN